MLWISRIFNLLVAPCAINIQRFGILRNLETKIIIASLALPPIWSALYAEIQYAVFEV